MGNWCHRPPQRPRPIGLAIAGVGVALVSFILLPRALWWFAVGVGLIVIGVKLAYRR